MSRAKGPGPRSLEALAWLERVDVAGLEPLGRAMGFGWRATYSHVERLAGAGLVERFYDRGGSVVAITRRGRRLLGAPPGDLRVGTTHGFALAHCRAMSWVAAYLTLRGRPWVGERALHRGDKWLVPVLWTTSWGTHRPDLVARVNGSPVAIEVELSHKAPRRLAAILRGYDEAIRGGRFASVSYVSDRDDVLAAAHRAATSALLGSREFAVQPLYEVKRKVRELSGGRPWPGTNGSEAP
jgi:DNA-binding transcriptional ArsR family regulator